MGDPNYKNETGRRNKLNRRIYIPRVVGPGIIKNPSGTKYEVQDDGSWRKVKQEQGNGI